jgi:putative endonuclease
MKTQISGNWGEQVALDFLKKKNFKLVKRGYRTRFGEIDLIVKDDRYIVFVEVKLRKNPGFASARESVGKAKKERIIKTAGMWLVFAETDLQPRFDVIEVYAPDGIESENPEIIHIENAFS